MQIIINRFNFKNVLKGQYISAQGNALGLETDREIVRLVTLFIDLSLFRTKKIVSGFFEKNKLHLRQQIFYRIELQCIADDIRFTNIPRALPWAEICWPFRSSKH
jgi:hypothetical protein